MNTIFVQRVFGHLSISRRRHGRSFLWLCTYAHNQKNDRRQKLDKRPKTHQYNLSLPRREPFTRRTNVCGHVKGFFSFFSRPHRSQRSVDTLISWHRTLLLRLQKKEEKNIHVTLYVSAVFGDRLTKVHVHESGHVRERRDVYQLSLIKIN